MTVPQLTVLHTVVLGLAVLGGLLGALGVFAVARQQSLQGDAISHAAFPGVALAIAFGGLNGEWLLAGGCFAGWLAMLISGLLLRRTKLPFDTVLAGLLAVSFGLGLAVMTYLQKLASRTPANPFEMWVKPHATASLQLGLDRYLFGQAAFLTPDELQLIAAVGTAVVVVLLLAWKEFKLLSFDPEFAESLGWPRRLLDTALTTLLVISVVLALKSVGVVLASALLVAPAVAARYWAHRLSHMTMISALFGVGIGITGVLVSHSLSAFGNVPTGPVCVLTAMVVVLLSVLFGGYGVVVQYRHSRPKLSP